MSFRWSFLNRYLYFVILDSKMKFDISIWAFTWTMSQIELMLFTSLPSPLQNVPFNKDNRLHLLSIFYVTEFLVNTSHTSCFLSSTNLNNFYWFSVSPWSSLESFLKVWSLCYLLSQPLCSHRKQCLLPF